MKPWRDYVVGAQCFVSREEQRTARYPEEIARRVTDDLRDQIAHRIAESMTVSSEVQLNSGGRAYRCEVVVVPVGEFMQLVDHEAQGLALRYGRGPLA
jgi:hypothetical protein